MPHTFMSLFCNIVVVIVIIIFTKQILSMNSVIKIAALKKKG